MGSHSVTCHPTQVNTPRHNPSQTGWFSIYLYTEGVDLGEWDGLPSHRRSLIQAL